MSSEWWPFVLIVIGGWLATDIWRWLGVLAGNRLDERSESLRWVRSVATALVMAVTAKLIVYPTGALEASPLWLRLGAIGIGLAAFFIARLHVGVGVLASVLSLALGLWLYGR